MPEYASFKAPGGGEATTAIHRELQALITPSVGDLLYVGQDVFLPRIINRTGQGVDVNGSPFAPYSTNGPYYFYPNGELGSTRRIAGTRKYTQQQIQKARATAAKGRHEATGRIGVRTPYGIRYASYAAAKAAHGGSTVNLRGMEQHTHMLDTIKVRVGGMEVGGEAMNFGSEFAAEEQNQPCSDFAVGFYGTEAGRARGNNEGTRNSPARRFFALSPEDLRIGAHAIGERMAIRAKAGRGASAPQGIATLEGGPIGPDYDVGF